ncbi:glycosyltransferase family 2 protein [Pseudoflavonifractor phocaeensis]|uniref:glycosyltransferase family 2 protein n=1 Tax=Pseudoflavonifractor phocaeensis TaxID=1870988 RepID=UPI001957E5C3|nr:glycosyltransferase family 2 protein [Pseudoflavonifractor phocaeensis]MBM6871538.1 glycosyltransferase family 2 protein [Pseudoflavonifractor phocaeensis]MBM6937453.1 glycosyltransferase family 2 protein [Pseudoflavonifractor phocaeensis]
MKITVFTPTYNRKHIILSLYHCLQQQSFHDFEWLVIDDGSTDGTEELFAALLGDKNPFPIRYYKFENSGKQKEINRALELARGKLFFIVDSDDLLTPNALELVDRWDAAMPADGKYCGFAGSDGDAQGHPTNPIFEAPYMDATFFDRDPHSANFIGYDRPWVLYTDVHRAYPYPEFEGETFITEAVVWNRMAADGYRIRCFNDVIYLREHQEIGLTNKIHEILVNNPQGYGLWIKEMIAQSNYNWKQRFASYYSFYCEMRHKAPLGEIGRYVGATKIEMAIVGAVYKIKHPLG